MSFSHIAAGIIGTLAMTIFIEVISVIFKKPFHVILILAYLLQFGKMNLSYRAQRFIHFVAIIVHYSIGVLFSLTYAFFTASNFLEFTLLHALLFGGMAGLIGITGWRIFFALHPKPPALNLLEYLSLIWLGHIVFSLAQFYTYTQML